MTSTVFGNGTKGNDLKYGGYSPTVSGARAAGSTSPVKWGSDPTDIKYPPSRRPPFQPAAVIEPAFEEQDEQEVDTTRGPLTVLEITRVTTTNVVVYPEQSILFQADEESDPVAFQFRSPGEFEEAVAEKLYTGHIERDDADKIVLYYTLGVQQVRNPSDDGGYVHFERTKL